MTECNTDPQKIPAGNIHSTILLLKNALIRLKAPVDDNLVEHIGIMIQQAMSMQNRSFHTPEHIFDLIVDDDPHYSLAAAFHDLVYYQVDKGFHPEIERILDPYLEFKEETIRLRQDIDPSDRAFNGTASVFGFERGGSLSPYSGLNEFLSALVMNSLLEGLVKDTDLLIATAGIEMTIPFRGKNENGRTPAELLAERIRKTNEMFELGLKEKEITQTVISAITLSNRDIGNFAEEDSSRFLDNTWKLLPETNPELFVKGLYTIKSYASALRKMEGFLTILKPENVFQQYAGYPEQETYNNLIVRTRANLLTAGNYLGIKMISAGILQALADLTGGDTPMSFFMGDVSPAEKWCSLTFHLPECTHSKRLEIQESGTLYRLFKVGRANSSEFDLQNSPLSFFIYCNLDEVQEKDCIDESRSYLNDELTPEAFLQKIPAYIVENIARAASVMAFTRRRKLEKIADSFHK